ncbi:unnamed protein product [Gulo gulo]|uniref:Uncharacterized protein n=1 Tax=Gulo gulo TaxID=48420 RepID=A0A9X9Q8W6_GULGU|nr:unnamed protein product [Gulo gulo]
MGRGDLSGVLARRCRVSYNARVYTGSHGRTRSPTPRVGVSGRPRRSSSKTQHSLQSASGRGIPRREGSSGAINGKSACDTPPSLRRPTRRAHAAPTPRPRRAHQDGNVVRDVTRAPSLRLPRPFRRLPGSALQGGRKRALGERAAAGLGSAGPESARKWRSRAAPRLPESAPARRGWGPAGLPEQPRRSGPFPALVLGFCPSLSSLQSEPAPPRLVRPSS